MNQKSKKIINLTSFFQKTTLKLFFFMFMANSFNLLFYSGVENSPIITLEIEQKPEVFLLPQDPVESLITNPENLIIYEINNYLDQLINLIEDLKNELVMKINQLNDYLSGLSSQQMFLLINHNKKNINSIHTILNQDSLSDCFNNFFKLKKENSLNKIEEQILKNQKTSQISKNYYDQIKDLFIFFNNDLYIKNLTLQNQLYIESLKKLHNIQMLRNTIKLNLLEYEKKQCQQKEKIFNEQFKMTQENKKIVHDQKIINSLEKLKKIFDTTLDPNKIEHKITRNTKYYSEELLYISKLLQNFIKTPHLLKMLQNFKITVLEIQRNVIPNLKKKDDLNRIVQETWNEFQKDPWNLSIKFTRIQNIYDKFIGSFKNVTNETNIPQQIEHNQIVANSDLTSKIFQNIFQLLKKDNKIVDKYMQYNKKIFQLYCYINLGYFFINYINKCKNYYKNYLFLIENYQSIQLEQYNSIIIPLIQEYNEIIQLYTKYIYWQRLLLNIHCNFNLENLKADQEQKLYNSLNKELCEFYCKDLYNKFKEGVQNLAAYTEEQLYNNFFFNIFINHNDLSLIPTMEKFYLQFFGPEYYGKILIKAPANIINKEKIQWLEKILEQINSLLIILNTYCDKNTNNDFNDKIESLKNIIRHNANILKIFYDLTKEDNVLIDENSILQKIFNNNQNFLNFFNKNLQDKDEENLENMLEQNNQFLISLRNILKNNNTANILQVKKKINSESIESITFKDKIKTSEILSIKNEEDNQRKDCFKEENIKEEQLSNYQPISSPIEEQKINNYNKKDKKKEEYDDENDYSEQEEYDDEQEYYNDTKKQDGYNEFVDKKSNQRPIYQIKQKPQELINNEPISDQINEPISEKIILIKKEKEINMVDSIEANNNGGQILMSEDLKEEDNIYYEFPTINVTQSKTHNTQSILKPVKMEKTTPNETRIKKTVTFDKSVKFKSVEEVNNNEGLRLTFENQYNIYDDETKNNSYDQYNSQSHYDGNRDKSYDQRQYNNYYKEGQHYNSRQSHYDGNRDQRQYNNRYEEGQYYNSKQSYYDGGYGQKQYNYDGNHDQRQSNYDGDYDQRQYNNHYKEEQYYNSKQSHYDGNRDKSYNQRQYNNHYEEKQPYNQRQSNYDGNHDQRQSNYDGDYDQRQYNNHYKEGQHYNSKQSNYDGDRDQRQYNNRYKEKQYYNSKQSNYNGDRDKSYDQRQSNYDYEEGQYYNSKQSHYDGGRDKSYNQRQSHYDGDRDQRQYNNCYEEGQPYNQRQSHYDGNRDKSYDQELVIDKEHEQQQTQVRRVINTDQSNHRKVIDRENIRKVINTDSKNSSFYKTKKL